MGDRNGGSRRGVTRFRGDRKARGRLWFLIAVVVSGMAVSAGINPIRSVSASASDTNSKFCKYHHSCSTNTGGGNVPSDTSRVMATIFLSNQDGLEKDRMRRSILHINYMCVLGCQTHTASSRLSFRGILDSVVSISFSAP